ILANSATRIAKSVRRKQRGIHRSRRMSMLVLTRKQGQQVVIDGNITVGVVHVSGKKVVLSFDAPGEICILRAELGEWQARSPDRHSQSSDADLKEKPAEWSELSFFPARRALPAKPIRSRRENPVSPSQAGSKLQSEVNGAQAAAGT